VPLVEGVPGRSFLAGQPATAGWGFRRASSVMRISDEEALLTGPVERETGLGPATSSLEGRGSTPTLGDAPGRPRRCGCGQGTVHATPQNRRRGRSDVG